MSKPSQPVKERARRMRQRSKQELSEGEEEEEPTKWRQALDRTEPNRHRQRVCV